MFKKLLLLGVIAAAAATAKASGPTSSATCGCGTCDLGAQVSRRVGTSRRSLRSRAAATSTSSLSCVSQARRSAQNSTGPRIGGVP